MPRHMGRGMGLAKLALGIGALRAANTAVRAAAWSSRPYAYYRPYSYYDYYDPYYYGGGYYGSYGSYVDTSSRGTGWFVAAVCVALVGACCLLIPGIAGIICCGVGIAAALGFTIGGIVAANSAPDTVVVKEQSNQAQVKGNSPEQSQEHSQSQSKGNCAEKPRAMAPKENQMCIAGKECHFAGYRVNTGIKKPEQMAAPKKQCVNKTNFATKYKNKTDKNKQQDVENKNAKFNQKTLDKQHKFVDIR